MIGDGSTPYEQLRISPTSTHTEIRNAYLKLRSDLHGEDLTKIQKAWELTWLPEHRATVDAFLFQLHAPNATIQGIAESIDSNMVKQEWHEHFDESKILEEAAKQTKHHILKSIWLGQSFHEMFRRPIPSVAPTPIPRPRPLFTRSSFPIRSRSDLPIYETPAHPRSATAVGAQSPLLTDFTTWIQKIRGVVFEASVSAWQTVRAIFTYPDLRAPKSLNTVQPDWTFVQLALATLFLFVLLSGMGYFIVNLLSGSDFLPLKMDFSETVAKMAEADSRPEETFSSDDELVPTLVEETQSKNSATTAFQPFTSLAAQEIAAPSSNTPQIMLTKSPAEAIEAGVIEAVAPTPLPLPTATVEPVILSINTNYFINLRAGPGSEYRVTEIIAPGQRLTASARDAASDWVQVQLRNGTMGWIFVELVTIEGDLKALPEVPSSDL